MSASSAMAMSNERDGTRFGFCMARGHAPLLQLKLYQVRVHTKEGLHVFDMWVQGKRPADKKSLLAPSGRIQGVCAPGGQSLSLHARRVVLYG